MKEEQKAERGKVDGVSFPSRACLTLTAALAFSFFVGLLPIFSTQLTCLLLRLYFLLLPASRLISVPSIYPSIITTTSVKVYTGEPGVEATATAPQSLLTGMNQFLQQLKVTFRRDPTNYRPRINKPASQKDKEQKLSGNFFFMDADDDDDI